MPYAWIDPELLLDYKGVQIYHVYEDDFVDAPYIHWFTTLECYVEGNGESFDIRKIALELGLSMDEFNQLHGWQDLFKEAIDAGLIRAQ